MTLRNIITAPDERLNTVCEDVTLGEPGTWTLAMDLVDTMHARMGQGLAAPQVGELVRVFCMRYEGRNIVMCNPRITRRGKDIVRDVEGCLSIPGRRVQVSRHRIIEVQWHNPDGTIRSAKLRGLDARCVQHEIDHLDGKLIA